jgi:3-oxoacyl-[acyl-carrier-protein] synthase II
LNAVVYAKLFIGDELSMVNRVVITGYGGLCSLGENIDEIWDAILNYRVGYERREFPGTSIKSKYFGLIKDNRERYKGIPKSILKFSPEFSRYALYAAKQALEMACGEGNTVSDIIDPYDIGVMVGTGWGGVDNVNYNNNDYRAEGITTSFSSLMSMPSVATGAVSLAWNLRGYQNTPVAACATGTMAIGDAYEIIKSGRQKMMLAGGSESLKEEFNVWSIDILDALSNEQQDVSLACCPFDLSRSGFVLSEGAAIVCLEELEHAKARGARILGEIVGYANYSDAFDMTAPAGDLGARVKVIQSALQSAGINADELDYINLHGTSTPLNDVNETNAVKAALGDCAYAIPMSSTKSYTGHLISAAGSMESIFCLKAIADLTVPATIHLNNPDPACDLDYTANTHRKLDAINTVMNLSFGFGGANCAIVFKRYS